MAVSPGPGARGAGPGPVLVLSLFLTSAAVPGVEQAAAPVDEAAAGAGEAAARQQPAARAGAALERMRETLGIPGLAVAVARDGGVVWTGSFGLADLEQDVAVADGTRFRAGEVSRLFTVAALLKLAEAGRLDPDAPIQRYVSSYPRKPEGAITARLLAGQLGGLGAGRRPVSGSAAGPGDGTLDRVEEAVAGFADDPLGGPPGERMAESAHGMVLLSAAVEGASGLAYLDYLEGAVLAPLGLGSVTADDPRAVVVGRARFYGLDEETGALRHALRRDTNASWGDAGMLASARDLARLGLSFLEPGLLGPESRADALTSMTDGSGHETGVGMVWGLGRDGRGRRIASVVGGVPGGRAVLLAYPDLGVVVALLTNLTDTPLLALETAQVAAAPFLPPASGAAVSGPPAGEYVFTGRFNDMPAAGSFVVLPPAERSPGAAGSWRSDLGWDWAITGVVPAADGFDLHLLHPQAGLLPLPLERAGEGWRARLAAGPHRFDVRVTREQP